MPKPIMRSLFGAEKAAPSLLLLVLGKGCAGPVNVEMAGIALCVLPMGTWEASAEPADDSRTSSGPTWLLDGRPH